MNKPPQPFRSRPLFMALGLVWQLIAVFFLLLTLNYLAEGAGLQLFNFNFSIVPGGLFIGWIHVMGFFIAAGISFSIGVGLCAFAKSASTPK